MKNFLTQKGKVTIMELIGLICVGAFTILMSYLVVMSSKEYDKTFQKAAEKWNEAESVGKVRSITPDDSLLFSFTIVTTDKEIVTVAKEIRNIQRNIEVRRVIDGDKSIICFGDSLKTITKADCYFEYGKK